MLSCQGGLTKAPPCPYRLTFRNRRKPPGEEKKRSIEVTHFNLTSGKERPFLLARPGLGRRFLSWPRVFAIAVRQKARAGLQARTGLKPVARSS